MMDPHEAALNAVKEFAKTDNFLEITYKVPFGFHEIPVRRNVSVDEFLSDDFIEEHEVCVIHILLGCGVTLGKFMKSVNKAIEKCKRVIVLEHNRASVDWDWQNKAEVDDHFLYNCIAMEEIKPLAHLYDWIIIKSSPIPGVRCGARNFIVEIAGKIPHGDFTNKFNLLKRRNVPIFAPPGTNNFSNIYDVYLGSADSQTIYMSNLGETIPNRKYTLYASCGGFLSLNYIHMLRKTLISNIVMFDYNPYSVEYAESVFNLIKKYDRMHDFLENYFLCEMSEDMTLKDSPFEERVRAYISNYATYNKTGKVIAQFILNGIPNKWGLEVYGMRNCADNRTDKPGKLLVTFTEDKYVDENSLNVGRVGWLEDSDTYTETRRVIKNTPVSYLNENILNLRPKESDIIVASNIFDYVGKHHKDKFPCRIIEN